jgi:serine phosphatase RsbU (regulator of sigma subunit)
MLAALSMVFMLTYVKVFLQFDKKHKNYLRVYHGFIVLIIISFFISMTSGVLFAISYPLLNGLSFITILYILYGLYLKYKSNNKPNVAVLMAFLGLVIGSILFILSNVNIINNEFLAANALKLGSAAEVLFLSIALAARYRQTQIEKIEAQEAAFKRLEEINTLKNEQNQKLEQQVEERTEEISRQNDVLSSQNREIINSINYAKRLQDAILPADATLEKQLPDYGIVYLPKDIVSGDFYWIETTKDHVFFAVADCTGHGVPGAMVSVVGFNALNRCIRELHLTDPGEILDHLTQMVEETFSKKKTEVSDGMDISLCVWDRKDKLSFAGAFNPLYLIRDGELIETKGDKQPIGKFIKRDSFSTHKVKLQKDDTIYLFSDGYADQFGGPRGKKLKYLKFKEYLLELYREDGESMSKELVKRFHDWRGDNEQIDDVCIMKVRF